MSIQSFKDKYKNGEITKHELIDELYTQFHSILFDYSQVLKDTEYDKIEITDGQVHFTTKETNFHAGGIRLLVDQHDKNTIPLMSFDFNVLEPNDSEIIFKMVKEGDVVFDIGANIGWYSIHLAKQVGNGHIHSFEPIPATFAQLGQNLALNGFRNVSINNVALSETPQVLKFYFSPQYSAAASARNITGSAEMIEMECQAITLDQYVAENNVSKLDFIKCDVEGAEYFVYKGGLKTLANLKPIVFTEMLRKWAAKFDYHPNDIIALFKDLGYRCFYSDNGRLIEIKEVTETTLPTNYLFLHQEKHADIIAGV